MIGIMIMWTAGLIMKITEDKTMTKVTIRRKLEPERQPKKVRIAKVDRGSGGDSARLAALLDEVMGK